MLDSLLLGSLDAAGQLQELLTYAAGPHGLSLLGGGNRPPKSSARRCSEITSRPRKMVVMMSRAARTRTAAFWVSSSAMRMSTLAALADAPLRMAIVRSTNSSDSSRTLDLKAGSLSQAN